MSYGATWFKSHLTPRMRRRLADVFTHYGYGDPFGPLPFHTLTSTRTHELRHLPRFELDLTLQRLFRDITAQMDDACNTLRALVDSDYGFPAADPRDTLEFNTFFKTCDLFHTIVEIKYATLLLDMAAEVAAQ